MQEERRRLEKERNKMESKEAELMEAANLVQERSREMDDVFSVRSTCFFINTGFQQALEIVGNLENHLKKTMQGKIMQLKKSE